MSRLEAQTKELPRWRASLMLGQYSAKIGAPVFVPFRPGLQGNMAYQWNKNPRHQLRESFILTGFHHQYLQTAFQLYTEFQYEWHFLDKFWLTPLALGGGYVASISDMETFVWVNNQYVSQKGLFRNNFLVSLGTSFGYQPIKYAPFHLTAAYRLQIQGIIVRSTVPMIAYSSLQLGAGFSFGGRNKSVSRN